MSNAEGMTFVAKCLAGETRADDIDDFVDRWHEGEGDPATSLAQYLGFTNTEYRLWAERPHLLPFILDARRAGESLDVRDQEGPYRPAASGLPVEDAQEFDRWPKTLGEVPS